MTSSRDFTMRNLSPHQLRQAACHAFHARVRGELSRAQANPFAGLIAAPAPVIASALPKVTHRITKPGDLARGERRGTLRFRQSPVRRAELLKRLRLGSMTGGDLAWALGVSQRTVYRDVRELQAAGELIVGEVGHCGGYRLNTAPTGAHTGDS